MRNSVSFVGSLLLTFLGCASNPPPEPATPAEGATAVTVEHAPPAAPAGPPR